MSRASGSTSRSSRRCADHPVHVDALRAGAEQRGERVDPRRGADRPVPVADQRASLGVDEHVVGADVGVRERVTADDLGVATGQRLRLGQVPGVEVGAVLVDARPAVEERREVGLGGVEHQRRGRRGQGVGHLLEGVEQRVEVVLLPRPVRRAGGDVLDAEDHPVVVELPQQAGGRHGRGQRGELASLLPVGVGEHPLGLGRGRLHEVAAAVLADQDGREAGGEAARLRDRRHDG